MNVKNKKLTYMLTNIIVKSQLIIMMLSYITATRVIIILKILLIIAVNKDYVI